MKISITSYGKEITCNTRVLVDYKDVDGLDDTDIGEAMEGILHCLRGAGYGDDAIQRGFYQIANSIHEY